MAEIIGDYGKHYADGLEYALDRSRYDKPKGYDGDGTPGTINISPSWNNWFEVVNKNEKAFKEMNKDDVDTCFHWFDGGFQYGMILGMRMES